MHPHHCQFVNHAIAPWPVRHFRRANRFQRNRKSPSTLLSAFPSLKFRQALLGCHPPTLAHTRARAT
eukprot:3145003-Pleurochrysis_carterae.AAC.3